MLEQLVKSMKIIGWAGLLYAGGSFFSGNASAADRYTLKNGDEIVCDTIEVQEGGYRVRMPDGEFRILSKSSVDIRVQEGGDPACKLPMPAKEPEVVLEKKVEAPVPKAEPKEPPKPKFAGPRNTYDGTLPATLVRETPNVSSTEVVDALKQWMKSDELPPKTDQPMDYTSAAKQARVYKMYADALLLYSRQITEYERFTGFDDKIADTRIEMAACLKSFAGQHFRLNHNVDVGPYAELFKEYQTEALALLKTQGRDHRAVVNKGSEELADTAWERLRDQEYAMKALQDQKRLGNMSDTNKWVDAMDNASWNKYVQEAAARGGDTSGMVAGRAADEAQRKAQSKK
jgi:hypothetical protein